MFDGDELDFWADVEEAQEKLMFRSSVASLLNRFGIPTSAMMFSGSQTRKIVPFAKIISSEGAHEIHLFLLGGIAPEFHPQITGNLLFHVMYALLHYPQIMPEYNGMNTDDLAVAGRIDRLQEICREEALIVVPPNELSVVFDSPRRRRRRNPIEGDEA